MLKKSWLRLGALLALLLVVASAPSAYATTITVDGNPATFAGEWPTTPATSLIVTDPDEGPILQSLDISDVYFTNNTTTIFWRVDTLAGTNWPSTTMVFCFDTDNSTATGSVDPVCNNAAGIDYIITFQRSGTTLAPLNIVDFLYCVGGPSCSDVFSRVGVQGSRQLPNGTGTVTEIGIPISLLRQTDLAATGAPNGVPAACNSGSPCPIPTRIILGNPASEPDDDVSLLTGIVPELPGPTPVTLTSFTAARGAGGVELAWASSSELNIQGYHVLRSAGDRAAATRITDALIPGTGSGITGGSYSYTDTTAAVGSSYSYWLEVVNSDGTPEEYGPVSYAPGTAQRTSVYLPLVVR